MKLLKIPKGYLITINTWENDSDNHRQDILHTTCQYSAECIFYICSQFASNSELNNIYSPSEQQLDSLDNFVENLAKKYTQEISFSNFNNLLLENMPVCSDLLYDIGLTKSSDFFTRKLESYKVELVEEDVYTKLMDW